MKDRGFSTRAIHTRIAETAVPSRPLAVPIYQTASFEFEDTQGLADAIADLSKGHCYSRLSNPTVDALERGVADLEGAEAALAFGSGMAAIHGVLVGTCRQGDHIVAPAAAYGGTFTMMKNVLPRFGIETTFVPNGDLDAMRAAIRPNTKVLYAETITNPNLAVADIPALAELAHGAGLQLIVDNTFATPYLARPVEQGADLVVHSASKYLGGHGDLIGGLIVGRKDTLAKMQHLLIEIGGQMAPFVAWLVLRGMKSLAVRMRQHCANALILAEWLDARDDVVDVRYPGLPSHPDHALAAKNLCHGFGAMIAFELADASKTVSFLDRLEIIARAGSLGDAHSLVIAPAHTTHRQMSPEEREAAGIPDGFVRFSVGLEDADDLIADLEGALA